jgi:hypothetical protein
LAEDRPPAEAPAGGRAGAGGTSSAAISGARDTSLARIAALTVIFDPVITLARHPARPAHAGQLAQSAPDRFLDARMPGARAWHPIGGSGRTRKSGYETNR